MLGINLRKVYRRPESVLIVHHIINLWKVYRNVNLGVNGSSQNKSEEGL